MPRLKFCPAGLSLLRSSATTFALTLPASAFAANLSTDLNDRAQSIDGFGTALAWFTDSIYQSQRSIYNNADFENLYFNELGMSMARMELQYTVLSDNGRIDPNNSEMETPIFLSANVNDNLSKFNFDALGVGHIKQFLNEAPAGALDDFKLMGSLWSPPHWMKGPETGFVNGQVVNPDKPTWGATANSAGGTLIDTPENLQQFGRYIATWLKGWERETGVPLYAISIQNELAFSEFYNSAVYHPDLYVKAINAVDDAIAEHNSANPNDRINTKLHGPEGVGVGPKGDLGILWRQFNYIDAVRDDPQANAALDIWSTHGADGNNGYQINFEDPSANSEQHWGYWNQGRSTTDPSTTWAQWEGVGPDSGDTRPTWQTERSGEVDEWLSGSRTNQRGALSLGVRMHESLVYADTSAYFFWQTQLDEARGADTNSLTVANDVDRPKAAAFRHFSKHIRPDAVRVEVDSDDPQLMASAYLHEDDGTLTYVLLNVDDESETVQLDLPSSLDITSIAGWLSQDGSYYQPMSIGLPGSGPLFVTLPRESMMTLVFGTLIANQLSGDFNGNGTIEQGDLDLVLGAWGSFGPPGGWAGGGPEGSVDQGELDAVLSNWGSSIAPNLGDFDAVPEPAGALALMGLLGATTRRRRRQA